MASPTDTSIEDYLPKSFSDKLQRKTNQKAEPSPITKLHELVKDDMEAANALIIKQLDAPVPLISEITKNLITAGGKRIRPLLTICAAQLNGYQGENHIRLASAVEYIHTATLLHDDVIDNSDLRRAAPTANATWGNNPAILVGDFLFARSFELMVATGQLKLLEILAHASTEISAGELLQMSIAGDLEQDSSAYFKVIKAKTATLFAAACQAGSRCADISSEKAEAMRQYGEAMGIAFQITDDVLDYEQSREVTGKEAGDDFRDQKITLPVLLAWQKANQTEKDFWLKTMTFGDQEAHDFDHALQLLKNANALTEARKIAHDYANIAKLQLDLFESSPLLDQMRELADYSASRIK